MRLNCFLKISETFSGPKQFVKLNPVDLKVCFQVVTKHDNFKVGDFNRCPSQDKEEFLSPQIHRKSFGTL